MRSTFARIRWQAGRYRRYCLRDFAKSAQVLGIDNSTKISQYNGDNNIADIAQEGFDHRASVGQARWSNVANVIQACQGQVPKLRQNGTANNARIMQQ